MSQAVTLRQMHEGKGATLAECLKMDFRLITRFCRGPSDFVEGVRALLIDKCGKPHWDPPTIDQARSPHVVCICGFDGSHQLAPIFTAVQMSSSGSRVPCLFLSAKPKPS